MTELKLYFAGEGRTELGDLARPPQYRRNPHEEGVLEALISRVATTPTVVVGAKTWKDIPTLRPGGKRSYERRRVGQLALIASEAGADVVVFTRDRDGDRERELDIENGVAEAKLLSKIVGGIAAQAIEAWVLALCGETRSESHADPKTVLEERHGLRTTDQKSNAVRGSDPKAIPSDATSLLQWLGRAREHLRVDDGE